MTGPMSGPGVGLALPQNLYPSELGFSPYDTPTYQTCLAPGTALPIPRGDWLVSTGMYSIIEYLDPVTGVWVAGTAAGWGGDLIAISSAGASRQRDQPERRGRHPSCGLCRHHQRHHQRDLDHQPGFRLSVRLHRGGV